jgi:hypothetical protein
MDDIQTEHERAVGDRFIAEFNRLEGANYVFERRGDPIPDLIYRDGDSRIGIEITSCYYNSHDAKVQWQNARGLPDAPWCWSGVDFDQALIADINKRIQVKCGKPYGPDCFLLVYVNPSLTTYEDMERLMPDINIPQQHPFAEIWLVGNFGVNATSKVHEAIWRLT